MGIVPVHFNVLSYIEKERPSGRSIRIREIWELVLLYPIQPLPDDSVALFFDLVVKEQVLGLKTIFKHKDLPLKYISFALITALLPLTDRSARGKICHRRLNLNILRVFLHLQIVHKLPK